ncbi:hypothetical protein VP1G_07695 [Cytospora mali]|uniref:Uncharacterized protein n=1 Tax=Cytospora mali TaxID=578113 RepID=A0A194V918_CYTMA|nr:hypothetical protein VP1G_07695 [Valsa mali var. pyri (nom. inval.)]
MASSFSQDFIQADRLIKRKYVRIPQDQKKLLDGDGAWSENLSHGPHRMVNVPPQVIEDVKSFHSRKNAHVTQQLLPVQPASPKIAGIPLTPSRREELVASPVPDDNDEEDDEGTPMTWSQSDHYAEQTPHTRTLISPQKFQPKRRELPAAVDDAPSSSAAQSEGLEMQAPEALSQESGAPVNRTAVPAVIIDSTRSGVTPPSAQVQVIPSTFNGSGQSDERQLPTKKQRKVEEITFPDEAPVLREQSKRLKASPRSLPMTVGSDQESSAATISTPSLSTQAVSEQYRQSSLPKAVSALGTHQESSSNLTATWEGRRAAGASQQENLIQAPQPSKVSQRNSTSNNVGRSLSSIQNTLYARTPYEKFRTAYPDYQESIGIFVSALLNVERLKRDWALPEFLYDDFVRAFSTNYLQYISMSVITNSDKVLTAVQWYNDRVKHPQYRKTVITKDNIHGMVKAHATEARKVRESIGECGLIADGVAHEEVGEGLPNEARQEQDDQEPEAEWKEGMPVFTTSPEIYNGSPGTINVETTTTSLRTEVYLMSQLDTAKGPEAQGAEDDDAKRPDPEKHAMEEDASGSRMSPELSINSPGPQVTGLSASIENERPEEVNRLHEGVRSPSRSFATQEDAQMEDYQVENEFEDYPEPLIEIDRPSNFPEAHGQSPEVVIAGAMYRNRSTPEVNATPNTKKTSAARQSLQNSSRKDTTPVPSMMGSQSKNSTAPLLCSSSPPSNTRIIDDNGDEPVQGPVIPLVMTAQNSPGFKSQADLSDEESETYYPPVEKAAVPSPRPGTYSSSAFRTQPQSSDEESDAFDAPVRAFKPPPPTAASSTPAFKLGTLSRTAIARTASPATVAPSNQTDFVQKVVTDHRRQVSRVSNSSSSGAVRSGSPASSEISYANMSMSKKRANESKEERSRRLKEHFRKRLSGKIPSSSAASKH